MQSCVYTASAVSRVVTARSPVRQVAISVPSQGMTSCLSAQDSLLQALRYYYASFGATRCSLSRAHSIKPGSDPEDVVRRISKDDVNVNFARSGGSGGQNVNKVNTKVDMRLNLNVEWLSEDMRDALQRLEKKKINKEGELVLTSQKTRSQADNVEDALEKLQDILDRAAESIIPAKPDPEKAKEIEKRKRVSNEHRIQNKKMNSEKKTLRRAKIDY